MRWRVTVPAILLIASNLGATPTVVRAVSVLPVDICADATIVGTSGNDTLIGTTGRDVIAGLAGDDVIDAGAGDDVICGGEGADTIRGEDGDEIIDAGPGADSIDGGHGTDRVSYLASPGSVTINLATGGATGFGKDTLHNIEDATGSTFDDTITGDGHANRLFGADGNDTIRGGRGNDRLSGGAGDDSLEGGEGVDEVAYFDAPAPVIVDLSVGSGSGWGADILLGIENVFGSQFDDQIVGGQGRNSLYGYEGDDSLIGDASDTLDGGSGTNGCTSAHVVRNCQQGAQAWPMFHRDLRHTGLALGTSAISPTLGPTIRWSYLNSNPHPPANDAEFRTFRWYSSPLLGDLTGDGRLEVIVTSADYLSYAGADQGRVFALGDNGAGNQPTVLWQWLVPARPAWWTGTFGDWGVDQYGAALVDLTGDNHLDVVFTTKDGRVIALRGTDGTQLWSYSTGHFIEGGPEVADLDGDGRLEIAVPTDCLLATLAARCANADQRPATFYVFRADTHGSLLYALDFDRKIDSEEPALVDLDASDDRPLAAAVLGSWDGKVYVTWHDVQSDGHAHDPRFGYAVGQLDPNNPADSCPAVRSSPLVVNAAGGYTAYFGWMPYPFTCPGGAPGNATQARISALTLSVSTVSRSVSFLPAWDPASAFVDAWKSSLALVPRSGQAPLIVAGYGIGDTTQPGNSANYGACVNPNGGVIWLDSGTGQVVFQDDLPTDGIAAGNVRSSPAVADVDFGAGGDKTPEVLIALGCDLEDGVDLGALRAYDGLTGVLQWAAGLGPHTIGSPAIGDIDGDGRLEIVVNSYDGRTYVLGS